MKFHTKIREVRKSRKLSQVKLANAVGITSSGMCQIEQGKRVPNLETISNIAKALDSSIDFLAGNTSDNSQPALKAEAQKLYEDMIKLSDTDRKTIGIVIEAMLSMK